MLGYRILASAPNHKKALPQELIPSQLRRAFQESYVSHAVLRDIEYDFGDAGLVPVEVTGLADGRRRDLVARYYLGVNWSDSSAASKVLAAYEALLSRLEDRDSDGEFARLTRSLKRAGFGYSDGRITTPAWFRRPDDRDNDDGSDLWEADHFRLFVSHVSTFKGKASLLRDELRKYQISCFVAHEDIQPSRKWLLEIQRGLRSMDALVALLSDGFHESSWTDQEIGFALGRGVHVISVIRDLDPYGFIGANQGIVGRKKKIPDVAQAVYRDLAAHELTRQAMSRALVHRFACSKSWADARQNLSLLEEAGVHTEVERDCLEQAFYGNPEIHNSFGVPDRLQSLIGRELELPQRDE